MNNNITFHSKKSKSLSLSRCYLSTISLAINRSSLSRTHSDTETQCMWIEQMSENMLKADHVVIR